MPVQKTGCSAPVRFRLKPSVSALTHAVDIMYGEFPVDNSRLTTFDIQTTNGIIHVIDAVIQLD